jgi:hypothetical protein
MPIPVTQQTPKPWNGGKSDSPETSLAPVLNPPEEWFLDPCRIPLDDLAAVLANVFDQGLDQDNAPFSSWKPKRMVPPPQMRRIRA